MYSRHDPWFRSVPARISHILPAAAVYLSASPDRVPVRGRSRLHRRPAPPGAAGPRGPESPKGFGSYRGPARLYEYLRTLATTRCEKCGLTVLLALAMVAVLTGCKRGGQAEPDIQFMGHDAQYSTKPDFARLEHRYPLGDTVESRQQLARLTPKYLGRLDQEQVDQIYARLTAGPIPDGPYDGDLFLPEGGSGKVRAAEIVGGLKGLVVRLKARKLEALGRILWKGKVFYRDQMILRNRVEDLAILAPLIDGPLGDIPKIDVDRKDAWLLFPARLYCGQSLLDGRRESLIIDYAFSDELEGYREKPDFLASRRGFAVRDEIRMIRPGFYLGRAYLDRVFVLNFTLYNKEAAAAGLAEWLDSGSTAEECWIGSQRLAMASASH